MAPYPRIYDVPPEILDLIFRDLSNDELLSLPANLLIKGLRASTAEVRFQYLHFGTNKDSLERLWRLSKYSGVTEIVKTLVIHTFRAEEFGLDEFLEQQWRRHLEDYYRRGLIPDCVTIDDAHEAVGVKSWRSCRTCAGLPPCHYLNRCRSFVRANEYQNTSGTAEAVLVYAFRLLLADNVIAFRIEDHSYRDTVAVYKAALDDTVSGRTKCRTMNVEHLPPALLGALKRLGLVISRKTSYMRVSGNSLMTSRIKDVPSGLCGDFAWDQLFELMPLSDFRAVFAPIDWPFAKKFPNPMSLFSATASFHLTNDYTLAVHRATKRSAEEEPLDQPPAKAARGLHYPQTKVDTRGGTSMRNITCEWPSITEETYEPLESSYSRLNGAFGT